MMVMQHNAADDDNDDDGEDDNDKLLPWNEHFEIVLKPIKLECCRAYRLFYCPICDLFSPCTSLQYIYHLKYNPTAILRVTRNLI